MHKHGSGDGPVKREDWIAKTMREKMAAAQKRWRRRAGFLAEEGDL